MSDLQELRSEMITFEQMMVLLDLDKKGLQKRIYTGVDHPPYKKHGSKYLFPRKLYEKWCTTDVTYAINEAS